MTDLKEMRIIAKKIRESTLNILMELRRQIIRFPGKMRENKKLHAVTGKIYMFLAISAALILLIIFFAWIIPLVQELPAGSGPSPVAAAGLKEAPEYRKAIALLQRDTERLKRKYNSYTTGQSYLVINTTDNTFHLYRNKKEIRTGFCSSGSYKMLQTEEGKSWLFKTPKGKFRIQAKTVRPVWTRPDWAFVEEGLPVPTHNHPSRYEHGVLGNYSLRHGDGYLIHGTIY